MSTGEAERSGETGVSAAYTTVERMVNPGGCAWHKVQTHESLIPFLIEETAEFVDAVERGLPASEVAEELGDVLYQVLFHAAIAERDGEGYDLDSIAKRLDEKLRARHPHVFGDRGYMSVEELNAEWERLKEDANGERRGSRSALEGIPAGMPTLARAAKVVERLKRAGLIDPESCGAGLLPSVNAPGLAGNLDRGPALLGNADLPFTEVQGEPSPSLVIRSESPPSESPPSESPPNEDPPNESPPSESPPNEDPPNESPPSESRPREPSPTEESLGGEILALVLKANAAGIDPDRALRLATARFAEVALAESLTGETPVK